MSADAEVIWSQGHVDVQLPVIYEQPVHQVPQQLKSPSNSLDYASAQPRETKLFALQVNGVGFLQSPYPDLTYLDAQNRLFRFLL